MQKDNNTYFFKKLVYLFDMEVFLSLIGQGSNHALMWDYPRFCDIDVIKSQLDHLTKKDSQVMIRHDLIMCCYFDILQRSGAVQNFR